MVHLSRHFGRARPRSLNALLVVMLLAANGLTAGKPGIEVTTTVSPVKLTFTVLSNRIKAGEAPAILLSVENVGEKDLFLPAREFHDQSWLKSNAISKYGVYFEVLGPDGKPLDFAPPRGMTSDLIEQPSGLLDPRDEKERTMADAWRRQGMGQHQIEQQLLKYHRSKDAESVFNVVTLSPHGHVEIEHPRDAFTRFDIYAFDFPGSYKIRAVADYRGGHHGSKARYGAVRARTRWVTIEVVR